MTCQEKLKIEHPDRVDPDYKQGCPSHYGYMTDPEWCGNFAMGNCDTCWNREIPDYCSNDTTTAMPAIKDSGDRTEFESGAVRDMHEGKGRCDLMPLDVIADIYSYAEFTNEPVDTIFKNFYKFTISGDCEPLFDIIRDTNTFDELETMFLEVAKHFEEGCKKYGENNWRKGIPAHCYVDSAIRHYLKNLRGDTDERHDRAFVWNILCCIWTCIHMPELNDYKKHEEV